MSTSNADNDIIETLREYKWLDLHLFDKYYNPLNISVKSGGLAITLRGIIILEDKFCLFFDLGDVKIDWRPGVRLMTDDRGNSFTDVCRLMSHYNFLFLRYFLPLMPDAQYLDIEFKAVRFCAGWQCESQRIIEKILVEDIPEEERRKKIDKHITETREEMQKEAADSGEKGDARYADDEKLKGDWKFQIDLKNLKKQEYPYKEIYSHKRKQPVIFETITTAWKRIQNDYLRSRGKDPKWKFDKFQDEFITIEKMWLIPGGFLLEFTINRTLRDIFTYTEKAMFFREGDKLTHPLAIVGEHYLHYCEIGNGKKRSIKNVLYFKADLKDDSPENILENLEFFDTYPEELFRELVHSILSIRSRKAELKRFIDEGNPFLQYWELSKDIIGDMNEVDASELGEASYPCAIQGPSFF